MVRRRYTVRFRNETPGKEHNYSLDFDQVDDLVGTNGLPAAAGVATGRLAGVSQPLAEPAHLPPASEQQVRSHAAELVELAARHGISGLAFASPGRLRGHVADDRDLFDVFEFQRAAADLLSAEVTVYSDGALRNQHVSPDLVTATPL